MSFRRISRPRRGTLRAALRILRIPGERAGAWPLVLAWGVLCGLLAFLPAWWIADWSERQQDRWFAEAHEQAARLTQEWQHWTRPMPAFRTGSEEAIRTWLFQESLVEALVDTEEGRVWIREKGHLRPARNPEEGHTPSEWARKAMEVSPFWGPIDITRGVPRAKRTDGNRLWDVGSWWLVSDKNLNLRKECAIVTFFGKWCLIKRWVPGSQAVEQWLRSTSRPTDTYRFGVLSGFRYGAALRRSRPLASFHPDLKEPPRPQHEVNRLEDAPFRVDASLSRDFEGFWFVVLQMTPEVFRDFRRAYVLRLRLAWLSYGLVVAGSGLALSLLLHTRNRERLQADRLASLAHSLKTPLAVLKLRCDTALNNELPREVQEAQLLEIRGGTDQLVHTIESGLEAMRSCYATPEMDWVDGTFFEGLDEKYTPTFEAQGRLLEVYGSDITFRCCASALNSALATLIENALIHGMGLVVVKATMDSGFVRISVSDEGQGIEPELLQQILRQRSLIAPVQPSLHPGQSMGLLVLSQLAKREGWGFGFSTHEPRFTALLEIPKQGA